MCVFGIRQSHFGQLCSSCSLLHQKSYYSYDRFRGDASPRSRCFFQPLGCVSHTDIVRTFVGVWELCVYASVHPSVNKPMIILSSQLLIALPCLGQLFFTPTVLGFSCFLPLILVRTNRRNRNGIYFCQVSGKLLNASLKKKSAECLFRPSTSHFCSLTTVWGHCHVLPFQCHNPPLLFFFFVGQKIRTAWWETGGC